MSAEKKSGPEAAASIRPSPVGNRVWTGPPMDDNVPRVRGSDAACPCGDRASPFLARKKKKVGFVKWNRRRLFLLCPRTRVPAGI